MPTLGLQHRIMTYNKTDKAFLRPFKKFDVFLMTAQNYQTSLMNSRWLPDNCLITAWLHTSHMTTWRLLHYWKVDFDQKNYLQDNKKMMGLGAIHELCCLGRREGGQKSPILHTQWKDSKEGGGGHWDDIVYEQPLMRLPADARSY